ncbi:MAG: DUF5132 domain-containing protein [Candidatus Manganitrophaceae bacterium]
MALFENGFKGNILTGLAIGLGATILAPVVVPVVAAIAKPLAKAAIKGGVLLYEKGRETVAEVGEVVEDLVAEAKMEVAEAQKQPVASAGPEVEKTA